MDRSVKQVLTHLERFLLDVVAYQAEERTSYTAEEFAQTRQAVMQEWAARADQLRYEIITVYPAVIDDAYPEYWAVTEAAISEGAADADLDI